MNTKELKKLIKKSGSILVMDEGEPAFVMVDYDLYKNLPSENNTEEIKINNSRYRTIKRESNDRSRESEILEKLNKEILALKHQIEMEENPQE